MAMALVMFLVIFFRYASQLLIRGGSENGRIDHCYIVQDLTLECHA
jgi:hypothetical protein